VVFLTGDRHHSEISRLKTENDMVIYDITSSALTSKSYDHSKELNSLRIPGSMIGQRNFAVVEVKGKRKERETRVTFFNSQGEQVFDHTLNFE
jgi:alkaline phosphatase D